MVPFVWNYSGMGIPVEADGIVFFWELFRFRNEWNIIPFILLSGPEGIHPRNRQNTRSLGNFLAGNPTRPLAMFADTQVRAQT